MNISRFLIPLTLILTSTVFASEIFSEESDDQSSLRGRVRSGSQGTPRSTASSDDLSSPELLAKFVICDDERYRPRGPSIHLTPTKTSSKHVSFGWIQFSDDRLMPSEDTPDTPENREHIRVLMLADARHGNLEYFRYLVRVWDRMNFRSNVHEITDLTQELSLYNQESLIFAAVLSDNVELFLEVMAFKGISFEDLDPFRRNSQKLEEKFSPHSYPPKGRSLLDEDNSYSSSEDEMDNIDETVFGYAIMKNSIEIVRLLLENGIRDDYKEGTETALHLAIRYGHDIIVRILLVQGNSQIERFNGALQTPLMTAIVYEHPRLVQLLIDHGAALNVYDHDHRGILHHAAFVGNLEILAILKKAIDNIDKRQRSALLYCEDLNRKTPLEFAKNNDVYLFMTTQLRINAEK